MSARMAGTMAIFAAIQGLSAEEAARRRKDMEDMLERHDAESAQADAQEDPSDGRSAPDSAA